MIKEVLVQVNPGFLNVLLNARKSDQGDVFRKCPVEFKINSK